MLIGTLIERVKSHEALLSELLESEPVPLTGRVAAALPDAPGVYRISEAGSSWDSTVCVGGSSSIRVRVCRNHLLGIGYGHMLQSKMLDEGAFKDSAEVEAYLRHRCVVQFIIVRDARERALFECFSVSVLSPRWHC